MQRASFESLRDLLGMTNMVETSKNLVMPRSGHRPRLEARA